jgi:hypothetical protein
MASLKFLVLAIPLSLGCSAAPYPSTVIVSGVNASVLSIENKALYWIDDRGVIMSTAVASGPNAPITAEPMLPLSFWVDTDRVYWGDRTLTVRSVDKLGGPTAIIASQQYGPNVMTGDAHAVYWANMGGCFGGDPTQCTSGGPASVVRYDKQTGQIETLMTFAGLFQNAATLAVDPNNLYWTDGQTLYQFALTTKTVAQWPCLIRVELFVGPDALYGNTGGGKIVRCTTDGAPSTTVDEGGVGSARLLHMTLAGSQIYFDDQMGVIDYLAISGGSVQELTRDRVTPDDQVPSRPLVASEAWLYWATRTEILRSPLPAN